MNCPKCGRTLLQGEICPCQQLDVYQRQIELEHQQELDKTNRERQYEQQKIKKSQRIKKISQEKNNFFNKIIDFFKEMIFNIKNFDNIEENYIANGNKTYAYILIILNILFTTILTYFLLSKSMLSIIFVYFSVFSEISHGALLFSSFIVGILSTLPLKPIMSFITGYREKQLFNISACYIFTIPLSFICIVLIAISPVLGTILLPLILSFKLTWYCSIFSKYCVKNSVKFISIMSYVLIFSIILLIMIKFVC